MIAEKLASRHQLTFQPHQKLQADIAKGQIAGTEVVLAKPTTQMNLSGSAVGMLVHFYKLQPEDVWLVYDELDLEFGKIRTQQGGGTAGHNGVASVLGTIGPNFIRWRLGIGRPPQHLEPADYVLHKFDADQVEAVETMINEAAGDITAALTNGHQPTSRQTVE